MVILLHGFPYAPQAFDAAIEPLTDTLVSAIGDLIYHGGTELGGR